MTPSDRYDTSHLPEDQYEPGSEGMVLKNLHGIISREEMQILEAEELWRTHDHLLDVVEQDQPFTVQDIYNIHKLWLGKIYPWAGKERNINMSKGGFNFAMARVVPAMMAELERNQLFRYTPCNFSDRNEIASALAEVHVELMIIHPFREGNGRIGRLLANLMALQAGLPLLDFSDWSGEKKAEYYAAVQAGMDIDYEPMTHLFLEVIEKSVQEMEEGL
jgi:cell filamentation protein